MVESRFTQERVVTKHLAMRASSALPSREQLWLSLFPREDLSFADLRRQLTSLRARGENALRYESAFWFRLILPFSTLVMMFVAVPLVLAAPRTTSLGQRIVVAALGGIGFDLLARTFMQLGLVYGWGPVAGAVLPTAVALGLASWAFRGVP